MTHKHNDSQSEQNKPCQNRIISKKNYDFLLWGTIIIVALCYFAYMLFPKRVSSEGSTPVAADLLTRAKAPGNSFAFLMTGVATDYTEIMVLKETTKSWKPSLFLPLITVPQVLVISYIINITSSG